MPPKDVGVRKPTIITGFFWAKDAIFLTNDGYDGSFIIFYKIPVKLRPQIIRPLQVNSLFQCWPVPLQFDIAINPL